MLPLPWKGLSLLLKGGVTIWALAYVGHKLSAEAARGWEHLLPAHPGWLAGALLLLPFNLGIEARKWQQLVERFYPGLRFSTALEAVLVGGAAGIFTPNRWGEYAGRVLTLAPGQRLEAAICTFVSRFAQMAPTFTGGALALALLSPQLFPEQGLWMSLGGLLCSACVALTALAPAQAAAWIALAPLPLRYRTLAVATLRRLDAPLLGQVLGWSALRYAVFTLQYVLLMYAFGFEGTALLALALASLVFAVKSCIPSVSLAELGIRESVALTLMGAFGVPALTAAGSALMLYVLNLALPALLGAALIWKVRC
jgi:hypothetical protein